MNIWGQNYIHSHVSIHLIPRWIQTDSRYQLRSPGVQSQGCRSRRPSSEICAEKTGSTWCSNVTFYPSMKSDYNVKSTTAKDTIWSLKQAKYRCPYSIALYLSTISRYTLHYFHFMPLSLCTALHFSQKYCTFYPTIVTFLCKISHQIILSFYKKSLQDKTSSSRPFWLVIPDKKCLVVVPRHISHVYELSPFRL